MSRAIFLYQVGFFWGPVMLLVAVGINPGPAAAQRLVELPQPAFQGTVSVEQALKNRRTIRRFANRSLNAGQLSQLLWAAYGVTDPRGLKGTPSAGALYPLDVYAVVGDRQVSGLNAGVYHYLPDKHALKPMRDGDLRRDLARASLHQHWMAEAPLMLVITGEYRRCQVRYGERGIRYTHMESGHAGQNIFLQAEALGLGAGIVGAFDDAAISRIIGLPAGHEPLLIMPVGYKF
ncbi:MAG: SagB/ThcOx family dehydrogenase [Deltaproteobacteria bacterium]|nr:SagB/ThcOx family dehydrogenase [Deltaproteobacteria bacterium]